jgi:hypothetical protein
MIANRITVHLLPDEQAALSRMVETDVRSPDAQLRYLLVEEARRRGLLPTGKNHAVNVVVDDEIRRIVQAFSRIGDIYDIYAERFQSSESGG